MTLIVLGLALWWAAHLWKRVAPGSRARSGDPGKGIVAVLVLAGLVLMVIGWRGSDWPPASALTLMRTWLKPKSLRSRHIWMV